jgi:hypothetical protein
MKPKLRWRRGKPAWATYGLWRGDSIVGVIHSLQGYGNRAAVRRGTPGVFRYNILDDFPILRDAKRAVEKAVAK